MSKVHTISIDAMGGDFGPSVTVPATIDFLRAAPNPNAYKLILVGIEQEILTEISRHKGDVFLHNKILSIHSASQVVGMDESPALALKRKRDSSMRVAINLVKEGASQACVSAGNTGALMATGRFVLKTIPGIDRPAICTNMPSINSAHNTYMLDLGANVDSNPQVLAQFAVMGSALAESVGNKPQPKIGLLNVGAEEIKGSEKVKATSKILSESSLNYTGYIESNEIYAGIVDVVVSDGFEGNVALKASEGVAKMIFQLMREEFNASLLNKISGFIVKPILKSLYTRLDPRSYNGASLLGLNGIVVKSHGGTDVFGFSQAIKEASLQVEMNLIEQIKETVNSTINTPN